MKYQIFKNALKEAYEHLFANDPAYAASAKTTTPEALAEKMANGFMAGSASKEGRGCKMACRALGIKCTYRAIADFIHS